MSPRLWLFAFGLGLAACAGCPITPPSPSPARDGGTDASLVELDGGDDVCARACANAAALGCGHVLSTCVSSCRQAFEQHLIDFDPECVANAPSKDAVRACAGGLACEEGPVSQ
jgi:hypothetical protein